MSVETENSAVIIPHLPNWQSGVRYSRRWDTSVVSALQGQEDRATKRVNPLHSIEYQANALSCEERSLSEARIMAAVKAGRAVVPNWAKPSILVSNSSRDECTIETTRYPWAVGDWVWFVASSRHRPIVNTSLKIDSGGYGSTGWTYDRFYFNGSPATTAESINTTGVDWPAPEAVYQSSRQELVQHTGRWNVPDPEIIYIISGLTPGVPCRVRTHFVNWEMTGYPHDVTIDITGDTTTSGSGNIYTLTSGAYWKVYVFPDWIVYPDPDGRLTISIGTNSTNWDGTYSRRATIISALEIHQFAWELRQLAGVSGTTLSWDSNDPINGYYTAGASIYPAVWGKPSIAQSEAFSNRLSGTRIRVDEPLPTVELGYDGWTGDEVIPVWDDPQSGRTFSQSRCSATGAFIISAAGNTHGQTRVHLALPPTTGGELTGEFTLGTLDGKKQWNGYEAFVQSTAGTPAETGVQTEWEADIYNEFTRWADANNYSVISYSIEWVVPTSQTNQTYFEAGNWYIDAPTYHTGISGFFIWPYISYTVEPND